MAEGAHAEFNPGDCRGGALLALSKIMNMASIKFDLINPTAPLRRADPGKPPPSPRVFRFSMLPSLYVAASMPPDVEVRIIDEDIEAIDFDTDADLIGISFMTYNAPRAYAIAHRFRAERGKKVIFGGYHPTLLPQEASRYADAVCVGDAEPVVPQIIEDFKRDRLKPVYTSQPASLAGLPIPRRDLIEAGDYAPLDVIQATRGCHYRCTFCSVASFHHYRFRTRPVDEVIEELKTLGRYVLFMDDSLTADRQYAKELFTKMVPLEKRWFSQCSLSIAQDVDLLWLAAESGCRGLFIGFESLSSKNLQAWRKYNNAGRDYKEMVDRLHDYGIAVFAGFVFGSDDDTVDVFEQTLDFLLEANVEVLQATRLTPFPGTPLYQEMEENNRIIDRDWGHYDFGHVVYEPAQMSRSTLDNGVGWVQKQFYSRRHIAGRSIRCLEYMEPSMLMKAVLPLNLGYRQKMAEDGTFRRGTDFARLRPFSKPALP